MTAHLTATHLRVGDKVVAVKDHTCEDRDIAKGTQGDVAYVFDGQPQVRWILNDKGFRTIITYPCDTGLVRKVEG